VARDLYDGHTPGLTYTREKKGGAWSAWVLSDQAATDLANTKVAKAGDTMTGNLGINNNGNAEITLNSGSGGSSAINSQKNGSTRWVMKLSDGAETGGNAGSNFSLYRYTDAGAFIGTPLVINRASGLAAFAADVNVGGKLVVAATTPSTSPTTGALTVAGGLGVNGDLFATALRTGAAPYGPTPSPLQIGYNNSSQYGLTIRPASDSSPFAEVFFNAAGSIVGSITTTGAATAYNTSSDARLKTDLQPVDDAGAILDAITVYDFAWIATGERSHGVIAQEMLEVYPQAVSHDDMSDTYGVDYSRFVPLLLQEIKTLRARVAALETAAI
jgi:hypothetical protein